MTYKMEVPAMTAVIYARYSSDNQREESIEGQIRECTAYAEKNGITIVKHYIDRAISAKTDNRPEFQQMIKEMTEVYPLRGGGCTSVIFIFRWSLPVPHRTRRR